MAAGKYAFTESECLSTFEHYVYIGGRNKRMYKHHCNCNAGCKSARSFYCGKLCYLQRKICAVSRNRCLKLYLDAGEHTIAGLKHFSAFKYYLHCNRGSCWLQQYNGHYDVRC